MITAGLTGGLASGKSFVADVLSGLGCHVIRADELGHQVLAPGGEAYGSVLKHFGRDILASDGTIDRRRLARMVFSDESKLALLNSLVHPAVFAREDRLIGSIRNREPGAIVIVEAAILIETGSYKRFDRLVLVVCSEEQQIERAVARGGLSRDEVLLRLKRQMPLAEKRKYADFVIDTSTTKQSTIEQTHQVFTALQTLNQ